MTTVPSPRPDTSTDAVDWRVDAACRTADSNLFYSSDSDRARSFDSRPAKRVCVGCPVRGHCLAFALEVDEPHGVWGGMDPAERRRHRRFAFRYWPDRA